jgi:hypothetical protein
MECKRGWSQEFMAANFPLSFRNDTLRKQRRKVLLEREKALLPAIQVYVEYKREFERCKKEEEDIKKVFGHEFLDTPENRLTVAFRYRVIYNEFHAIKRERNILYADILDMKEKIEDQHISADDKRTLAIRLAAQRKRREELKVKREAIEPEFNALTKEYETMRGRTHTLISQRWRYDALYNDRLDDGPRTQEPRREFIMKCPADECRGFLSTSYKCGTCSKWACNQCLVCIGEDKEAAHTCNPDTVESAKMIRAETRPCPKCGTRIFKIDGCDQMWCVMDGCHTAFSWNTGHIVTGIVHNPHYYEWLRRNGGGTAPREAGDIPCGGLPATWQWMRIVRMEHVPNDIKNSLLETHRNMRELIADKLPEYPARPPQLMNKDDDVNYLMNRLTELEWQRRLEISEARFKRKKEIGQIVQTLITAGSDMMNRIYERSQVDTDMEFVFVDWLRETGIPELEQLRSFGNESLKALAKRDHMAVPQLETDWKWKPLRALYRAAPKAKKGAAAAAADADPTDEAPPLLDGHEALVAPAVAEIPVV